MLRVRAGLLLKTHRWVEFGLVVGAFATVWLLYPGIRELGGEDPLKLSDVLPIALAACLPWPLLLESFGLYRSQRREDLDGLLGQLLIASGVPTALAALVAYFDDTRLGPRFALACGAAQFATLAAERIIVRISLRLARRSGRNIRYVAIVGTGPRAALVTNRIQRHPEWGLRIVAYFDDQGAPLAEEIPPERIHKLHDLGEILAEEVIDEVIVAYPRSLISSLDDVASLCAAMGVPFTLLADLFGDYTPLPRMGRIGRELTLTFAPVHHGAIALAVKRALDIVGASLALVLCGPILAMAALAVRRSSPGPILFRQVRMGLHGRRFQMLKLRTMFDGAEALQEGLSDRNEMAGPVFKLREDPRVTRVGRTLRRYSVDELPQLWNVLKGDMSLVGPRPPIPTEVAQYEPAERRRLSMRPGLTCLWQVSGRNSIGFDDWVKLDLEYIDQWSPWLDLQLLLRTIPAVVGGRGAS